MRLQVELLRSHEAYAYQVAYYLLRQEEAAITAVQRALIAVAAEETFFGLPPAGRESRLKREVIRKGLELRRG